MAWESRRLNRIHHVKGAEQLLDLQTLKRRIAVAAGEEKADLVIKNGKIINVFTHEITSGDIAVVDGYIAGVGQYEGNEVVDATGMYITPGFIDGHVHIESSLVAPLEFAKTVLPHGVTTVIADPHEIANVSGTKGIEFMLDASDYLPFDVLIMLPSSVPATPFEHSGATLEIDDLKPFLTHPRVLGLAEVMNFSALKAGEEKLLDKIITVYNHGGKLDGHGAGKRGDDINVFMAAMIRTDHESISVEEALDRLQRGMYLMIRQGTTAKDLKTLIPLVNPYNSRRTLFVTDDKHLDDLHAEGSIDHNIRLSIQMGIDPITAIQMATLNAAECFGLTQCGAIAAGYKADLVFLSDLEHVTIEAVYKNGSLVAHKGNAIESSFTKAEEHFHALLQQKKYQDLYESVHLPKIQKDDLLVRIHDHGLANVIGVVPNSLVTKHLVEKVNVVDGYMVPSIAEDLLKIAVIERHHHIGTIGVGIVKGFELKKGAIATTVGHDSHNIIAVGTNDEDIIFAAQALEQQQGGLVVVNAGQVLANLPLAISGLLSNEKASVVLTQLEHIHKALNKIGASQKINPFLILSFLALPVIPQLKMTDNGLFDVTEFKHISVSVEN